MQFKNTGTAFSAHDAARDWCDQNGYVLGPMQGSSPRGIMSCATHSGATE